jgi:hypothetical protein
LVVRVSIVTRMPRRTQVAVTAAMQRPKRNAPTMASMTTYGIGYQQDRGFAAMWEKVVRPSGVVLENSSVSSQSGTRNQSMMSPQPRGERYRVVPVFASALKTGTANRTHPRRFALPHGTDEIANTLGAVSTGPLYSDGFTTSVVAPRRETSVGWSTRIGLSHSLLERRRGVVRFPRA